MPSQPTNTLVFLAAVLGFCAGCDSDGPLRAAVRGTVSVDGKPLKKGSIVFVPVEGTKGPKAAGQIIDGSYELPEELGPVVGRVRVEIRAEQNLGFALDDPSQFTRYGGHRLPANPIPARYNERSQLVKRTVAGEVNRFDFAIETKIPRNTRSVSH